jgi:hypothetical protein
VSKTPEEQTKHLDEMTCMLYIERQLDRARGLEVSAHTQDCADCRTLLRALERESRLLTRAMLEEDEPLGWQRRELTRSIRRTSSPGKRNWNRRDSAGRTCWAC